MLSSIPPPSRPLLIYDDRCLSCKRFAFWVRGLSRGWICLAGHYYSPGAMKIKKEIFPDDYDPTKMFWLINENGAFGGRSGLMEAFKEIIRSNIITTGIRKSFPNDREGCIFDEDEDVTILNDNSCSHLAESGCASVWDTCARVVGMLRNSDKYLHHVK